MHLCEVREGSEVTTAMCLQVRALVTAPLAHLGGDEQMSPSATAIFPFHFPSPG